MDTSAFPETTNTQQTHDVYVMSFAPANESFSVGGYYWHPNRGVMEKMYTEAVQDSAAFNGASIVRLLRIRANHGPLEDEGEALTDELNSRIDELESTAPALRQHVPPNSKAEWIPTGGVNR